MQILQRLARANRRLTRSDEVTKLLWIVNDAYTNTFKCLYRLANRSPNFDVKVAAVDSAERGYSPLVDKHRISTVLSASAISHQVGISTREIDDFQPHWIFVSRPYNDYAEEHLLSSELRKRGRLAHLSYGSVLRKWEGDYGFLATNQWLADASAFFVSSVLEFPGDPKFVPVGQLKLDEYVYFGRPIQLSRKPSIAWKPRWTATDESSLEADLEVFIEIAKHGEWEVRLISHPMMLTALERSGQRSLAKAVEEFSALTGVSVIEGPDFLDALLGADVFVGDTSSTLAEFVWTGKPIIWSRPPMSDLNELGGLLVGGSYVSQSSTELIQTLRKILHDHWDPLLDRRQSLYREAFVTSDVPLAKGVLDYLTKQDAWSAPEIARSE